MGKELFNDNWYFIEHPIIREEFSYSETKCQRFLWNPVNIPHDWLIYDTKNLYRDSEGWYRKKFIYSKKIENNQLFFLQFDGVYMDSSLFVNGQYVGEWKYGYTAFEFEISKYLISGENEIFVRVKHQAPNSRWYSGAGIYRNVWFRTCSEIYIENNGIYLHTKQTDKKRNQWELSIETSIFNVNNKSQKGQLEYYLLTDNDEILIHQQDLVLTQHEHKIVETILPIKRPRLWSIENPFLYRIKIILRTDENFDTQISTLGFRKIEFHPELGLFLNGENTKIHGVCLHHDLGALGSAFNRWAAKRQLKKLKEMGVNAIRISHNPAAKEFLELTDEMGFLVQSELTDVWKHSKNTFDYARFFDQWAKRDVRSWILRDRNHPSVFMWSIGNEIYDTHGREDGLQTAQLLISLVKKYDKKENAPITFASNYLLWENTQKVADIIKLVGYNYAESLYYEHHKKHPDWIIYGSETCSVAQSRGVYHFPLLQNTLSDDDRQCSSLGNSSTSWGAKSVEDCLIQDRDIPFSMGQFLWSGIDYIGEPTPYNTKNSYLGQIDTAVFPKDAYYICQAMWVDYRKKAMIHIFPYWDFSKGQLIDVRVVTNAPILELFFNKKSLGKRLVNIKSGNHLIENWQFPYEKGEWIAIAYDEKNKEVAREVKSSFGNTASLLLKPDRDHIIADSDELIFVEIQAVDSSGLEVANANNRVTIEVTGMGRLVGIDNGDSTDYDQFKGTNKRLFNGKLLAIIAPKSFSGKIIIKAKSQGLPSTILTLYAVKGNKSSGKSNAIIENKPSEMNLEIPVRKIELENLSETNQLNQKVKEVRVRAKIFPENATTHELTWRLTDVRGINTQVAELRLEEGEAVITAIANGKFYLRCGTNNHSSFQSFYSLMGFDITELSEALLNPYLGVSGGLYSRSNVALTNGNERSAATLRNAISYVVFDKVDFGKFGSRLLTLSLFPLEGNVFSIEVWTGYPYEQDSKMIDIVYYTKGTIWNTYQEENYKLSARIKGIQTLSFVFKQKVHIKEFIFEKESKAFSELSILENDLLYGDSYEVLEDAIERIGNNVTIRFSEMDFGEKGSDCIEICGKSLGRKSTILFKTFDGTHDLKNLLEFPETSDSYEKHKLYFPRIYFNQIIEFIFLPGSDFNFKSFQFF